MKSLVTILLFQIFAFSAIAADDTHLLDIKSAENSGKTTVQFELSKPVPFGNLEARFLRRTVEWDLKGVQLKKDKIFQKVGSGNINNVYVSQSNANTSRIRVNLEEGATASDFSDRVSFSKNGSTLTMVMDPSVAAVTGAAKEMNKVYAIGESSDSKYADQLGSTTLKVSATPSEAAKEEKVAASDEDVVLSTDSIEGKSESEIPLTLKKAGDKTVGAQSASRMAIGFAIIGLLGLSAFMVGKKINAKRLSTPFSHDSITVISQKYLGPKRNLTMVRVAGEYMLLGVTDHNISLIKTLSVVDDEIPELSPKDFGAAMKSMTGKGSKSSGKNRVKTTIDDDADEIEDSFSVSSLNDVKNIIKQRKYIDEADF
jgi:flagellar protein FliO/FliZ